jgi:hypothetical protein
LIKQKNKIFGGNLLVVLLLLLASVLKTGAFTLPESLRFNKEGSSTNQSFVFLADCFYASHQASINLANGHSKVHVNLPEFLNLEEEEEDDDQSNELFNLPIYDKYFLKYSNSDNSDLSRNKTGALYISLPLYVLFQSWKHFLS